jgi:uncharacterized membrane protein YoaT (DUF817 family)
MKAFLWEFFVFGMKQARACIFAGTFLVLLVLSKYISFFGLARYDFLCLAAILMQIILLWTGIESKEEAMVLCVFHAIGLMLELFKTHPAIGAWSYPEEGYLKLGTVPLYSGFMYAAIASYMCQAWRLLKLDLERYPSYWLSLPLAVLIYLNFFTRHFLPDLRWFLIAAVFVVFWRAKVHYVVLTKRRTMPVVLSFALIGFFVWVAENWSTYFGAWVYPQQRTGWQFVSFRIFSSWFLMVIISCILVADLKHLRKKLDTLPVVEPLPEPAPATAVA